MRVLLVGTGGREHALAVALADDAQVERLVCAPGNPGMADIAEVRDVEMGDVGAVAALAVEVAADLVVIGPEAPLVAGAADAVRGKGIACFGPSAAAAAIEGSKSFAKEVMASAGVPTARAVTCRTPDEAAEALDEFGPPYVVKDDALAAGKGVVVTDDRDAALAHASSCGTVVIEEYLDGPEVSLFVVTDGETAVPLLPAQDFKRFGEDDTGPNTGGMGAYAPLPWAPDDLVDSIMSTVAEPTLAELAERDARFVGTLYCGLALTAEGPKVIEFNCRFGDPEIQAVLALLDMPLAGLLDAAARGRLAEFEPPRWRDGAAVCLVLASQGYPDKPVTGKPITGADRPGILHAGTTVDAEGRLVSSGGRVLNCVAPGADLSMARRRAYALAAGVDLPDGQLRRDIALAASEGRIVAPRAYSGDDDEELEHGFGAVPQVPSAELRRGHRPGTRHRTADLRDSQRAAQPRVPVLRAARLRQDVQCPHSGPIAELREGADADAVRRMRILRDAVGERGGLHRRHRDRRGQPRWRRRRPGTAGARGLRARQLALQDLRHRRGAHGVLGRVQRAAETGRRAARLRHVRLRDHRAGEGTADDPVTYPPLSL